MPSDRRGADGRPSELAQRLPLRQLHDESRPPRIEVEVGQHRRDAAGANHRRRDVHAHVEVGVPRKDRNDLPADRLEQLPDQRILHFRLPLELVHQGGRRPGRPIRRDDAAQDLASRHLSGIEVDDGLIPGGEPLYPAGRSSHAPVPAPSRTRC